MMSSSSYRPFDDLADQYDDDWYQIGLEDDTLKCTSPTVNGNADTGLSVPSRSCPSPLGQIPTREPYSTDPPPKLSPVSSEPQTFITLSNSRVPPVPAAPSQQILQIPPLAQSSEVNNIDYEIGSEVGLIALPSASPVLLAKTSNDVQLAQTPVHGAQQNGVQPGTILQQQAQQAGCVQALNGQWFVQAQVQHVQTSAGTVIAVVPNFCRAQAATANGQVMPTAQASQPLIAHAVNNSLTNAPTAAHQILQTQPQHQIQHAQQVVHTNHSQNSLAVGVLSNAPHNQTVMQHLLSQPTTITRQQILTPAQTPVMAATMTVAKKQRNLQPRANGRKKNYTPSALGNIMSKANRGSNTSADVSSSHVLPSRGIEMRLSVQNSEQVANLSKEIARLQNMQAAYNIDNSAEIRELEQKRAQIFFEALEQQHKGKDLLSAVNMKVFSQSNKQRNNTITDQHAKQLSGHQMHPSTSYEQQHSTYDNMQTSVSVAYGNNYQIAQYLSSQTVLQRGAYDSRGVQQVSSSPYSNYRAAVNSMQVQNKPAQNFMRAVTDVSRQQTVLVQSSTCADASSLPSLEMQQPLTALYNAPVLKSSAEIAADVAKKKEGRARKLNEHFDTWMERVNEPDVETAFSDLSDALQRLLPYHCYAEPDLTEKLLNSFDHDCLRQFVHLTEKKNHLERRLRSLFYKEAMRVGSATEESMLLSLDLQHERGVFEGEKGILTASGREAFVANSELCQCLDAENLESRRKELGPKNSLKLTMHFEYHQFNEREIAERCISPFSDISTEEFIPDPSEEETNPPMLVDEVDERIVNEDVDKKLEKIDSCMETTSTVPEKGNERNLKCPSEIQGSDVFVRGREVYAVNDKNVNKCVVGEGNIYEAYGFDENSASRSETMEKTCGLLIEESNRKTPMPMGEFDKSLTVDHSPSTKFLKVHRPTGGESGENCASVEESSKSSEQDVCSCDNDLAANDDAVDAANEMVRPPIKIKIALTDTALKNCSSDKKSKQRKKKKRKHVDCEADRRNEYNSKVNGYPPGCSESKKSRTEVHGTPEAGSHPRLLMRISLKNRIVVADWSKSQIATSCSPTSTDYIEKPPPRVPKIKIKLPTQKNDNDRDTVFCQKEPLRKIRLMNKGESYCVKRTAALRFENPVTASSSEFGNASLISCVTAGAQFSPVSDITDEEAANEQARAEADSVISRLDEWSKRLPGRQQSESLSRLLESAPMSAVLDQVIPDSSWLSITNKKSVRGDISHSLSRTNFARSRVTTTTGSICTPKTTFDGSI